MPPEPSVIDRILAEFETPPSERESSFADYQAARAELADLRRRAEDAELLLWHALHNKLGLEGHWITYTDTDCTIIVGEEEDGEPIEMDMRMRDGLPLLTPAARERLRG